MPVSSGKFHLPERNPQNFKADFFPESELYLGSFMPESIFEQEFKINTVQDDISFGQPEIKADFPVKAIILKKSGREFILRLTGRELKSTSGRFKVEVTVPVNNPEGWAPLKVILTGRLKPAGNLAQR